MRKPGTLASLGRIPCLTYKVKTLSEVSLRLVKMLYRFGEIPDQGVPVPHLSGCSQGSYRYYTETLYPSWCWRCRESKVK